MRAHTMQSFANWRYSSALDMLPSSAVQAGAQPSLSHQRPSAGRSHARSPGPSRRDGVVRHREPELVMQPHDQIAGRERTTPWIAGIGPSSTSRRRKALCVSSSLGGAPGEGMLMRPSGPCSLYRITQLPQCLTVHPADLRCFLPRSPVEHARKRQKPSRLRPILRASRKPPNLTGRIVRPNRHCLAHGKQPSVCHLESHPPPIRESLVSYPMSGWFGNKPSGCMIKSIALAVVDSGLRFHRDLRPMHRRRLKRRGGVREERVTEN